MRLAAISVDLDEIPCYGAIHGLDVPSASARVVYERAVPRLAASFRELGVPATFFAVGADARDPERAAALRDLRAQGHEIASHSDAHRYDLSRLSRPAILADVRASLDTIEQAVGARPRGFRAPGYTMTSAMLEVLEDLGLEYDSSIFPCPAYYVPKAVIVGARRLRALLGRGRASRSIVDDPRVVTAPADPYFPHRASPFRSGSFRPIVELPIGVTRLGRLPFIGTSVALARTSGARQLARMMVGRPLVVFELHGIDLADAREDGLEWLAPYQPDLRLSLGAKRAALAIAIETLASHGYEFVTTETAARLWRAQKSHCVR